MKTATKICALLLMACIPTGAFASQSFEVTATFNPSNVILPSSQYTPEQPYTADVWVFNEGKRYQDSDYNHVWATPDPDSEGRAWFDPQYDRESAGGWEPASAPYSSDEYYLGQKSYRWITSDITGDIYLRRTFTLASIPEGVVFLACGHDDAPAEWYINGELVHSVADGWNNEEYQPLSEEGKALLKADGTENVVAVHVHQNWGGAFADCGLYEADMSYARKLLNTVDDGEWPCRYYLLNYNSDIAVAENGGWQSVEEDEVGWVNGTGPFSNDANKFFITMWPSKVRPILVRRHFTLSAEDIAVLGDSEVRLSCSYDENPKVYLNGELVWSATGWNDNDYARYNLTEAQKELLREGDNVLAVSLSQGDGGGHIDYGLELVSPYSATGINDLTSDREERIGDTRVFNLHGQYLGNTLLNLPAGIYITGGRKVTVK